MQLKTKRLLLASIVSLALLQACKKNKDVIASNPTPTGGTTSSADKIKDSTIADARDIYLWYSQIPSTFNARSYTDPNAIMEAIRQYSNEPGFSTPVDKWSFGMKQTDWDNLSNGVSADFGMTVFFMKARLQVLQESIVVGRFQKLTEAPTLQLQMLILFPMQFGAVQTETLLFRSLTEVQ